MSEQRELNFWSPTHITEPEARLMSRIGKALDGLEVTAVDRERGVITFGQAKQPRPTIEQRFADFHAQNPHVMAEMLRLARARLDRGETRVGAKALWEELRQSIRVCKLGEWRLDNSLTALYARALIEAEPRLVGVIETRRRKAK